VSEEGKHITTEEWRESLLNRIRSLEADIKVLSDRLTHMEIKDAANDVHRKNVETRLSSIEDSLKWLVRLILSALVLAVMAFVIGGGLVV
jgi:hypothetical protein